MEDLHIVVAEMSTGSFSWGGKDGRCVELTTLPYSCANCLEIWEPQPPGTFRACPGLLWDCFCFYVTINAKISSLYFVLSRCIYLQA
jgi:hypothetical protein